MSAQQIDRFTAKQILRRLAPEKVHLANDLSADLGSTPGTFVSRSIGVHRGTVLRWRSGSQLPSARNLQALRKVVEWIEYLCETEMWDHEHSDSCGIAHDVGAVCRYCGRID
jgi:hypothetical protein